MRTARIDLRRARVLQRLRALADRARGIDHVVDHKASLARNVADDVHDLHDVRLGAALVDDGDGNAEFFGYLSRALDAADIGRNDHVDIPLSGEIVVKGRAAQQIIDGDIEKALNLFRMKVHGKYSVRARRRNEIGHQLCGDGIARTRLSVLTRIAEIRNHRRDSARAGTLGRVDHDQKLHEVIVDGRAGGLNNKQIPAANRLLDVNTDLAVGERGNFDAPELGIELVCNRFRQRTVRITGEQLDFIAVSYHEVPSFIFYPPRGALCRVPEDGFFYPQYDPSKPLTFSIHLKISCNIII